MRSHTFTLVDIRYALRVLTVAAALALTAVPVDVFDTAAAATGTDDPVATAVNENVPPASTLNTPWG
jgi:hypothetical protein